MKLLGVELSSPDSERMSRFVANAIFITLLDIGLLGSGVITTEEARVFLVLGVSTHLAIACGVRFEHGLRGFAIAWLFGLFMMTLCSLLESLFF